MDQDCIVSGAPAGPVVQVCFPSVRAAVLDSLNGQREEGRLCDLSIQVQGQVFRAHRCVLAASSPYFHDQVLLKNVTTVSLPSVMDPVAFESVLSSAYTGRLSIVRDDIVNYVTVASFLQMWHIVDKCTEILKRPRPPTECNPQSPSSTECLYMEREGKEKETRTYGQVQNALPPLATWRRPHQFPRGSGYGEDPQEKKGTERVIEASEGMGKELEEEKREGPELRGHSGKYLAFLWWFWSSIFFLAERPFRLCEEGGQPEGRKISGELQKKEERQLGRSSALTSPHAGEPDEVIPGPSCLASTPSTQKQWQASPWSQQEEVDFGRFADGAFGRETYDEIEDGTGQVSQRPLVPTSPDDNDFILGAPGLNWPNGSNMTHGGKVHFCHCGKAYTLKSMRDRHVKMQHLNLRPFACPVCAKSFKMKHHLTKHLKTHGGLRPYECGLCGKKVIWRDSFLRHQARCERLAESYDGAAASSNTTAAADMDDGYAYGFKEGEVFFSQGGQQADCQGEAESGMSVGVGVGLGLN
ncbi:unnamed protein product [Oncorhynchus mykiss]|uniref:Zinc finger and BTB domain containing 22a n=1 Tax=Oncorhynchus mykiss TaxID=8022 RepID=A0A060W9K9_ONCMY|nr:unnamed protein product [Oncorhynchus mykiss]